MHTDRWVIDTPNSALEFAIRHLMLTKTRGRFTRWSGTVSVPDGDISRASVDVVIDASSIDTGIEKRDEHLRSADYFDVERYPIITFTSRGVVVDLVGRLAVTGALTIKGMTHHVTLNVESENCRRDPSTPDRARVLAVATFSRRDFGFTGNAALDAGPLVLGNQIEVEIVVAAVKEEVPEPGFAPFADSHADQRVAALHR